MTWALSAVDTFATSKHSPLCRSTNCTYPSLAVRVVICWLVPLLQVHWSSSALLAVLAPFTSAHLPECRATRLTYEAGTPATTPVSVSTVIFSNPSIARLVLLGNRSGNQMYCESP